MNNQSTMEHPPIQDFLSSFGPYFPQQVKEHQEIDPSTDLTLCDKSWPASSASLTHHQGTEDSLFQEFQSLVGSNLEKMKLYTAQDLEEERRQEISTQLKLYLNPFTIRKKLTESDLGGGCRLMVSKKGIGKLVLSLLNEEEKRVVTKQGLKVDVWDIDTATLHPLVFKNWGSSSSYVFIDKWVKDFVERRDLKGGDEIGLFWDVYNSRFCFTVFR